MSRWKTTAWAAGLACVMGAALASPPENPFEGSWAGIYQLPKTDGGGTAEFDISNTGVVHGTTVNNNGTVHTLVGRIKDDGWIVGVATSEYHGYAEFFSGHCVVDANGNIVCDLVGCIPNDCFDLVVIVAPN